ncbi:hypothetical protein K474DRAFT_1630276, partial [Panus rudis PR-1116 ss-1]
MSAVAVYLFASVFLGRRGCEASRGKQSRRRGSDARCMSFASRLSGPRTRLFSFSLLSPLTLPVALPVVILSLTSSLLRPPCAPPPHVVLLQATRLLQLAQRSPAPIHALPCPGAPPAGRRPAARALQARL